MYKVYLAFTIACTLIGSAVAETRPSLSKLWTTKPLLNVPESALYDARRQVVYVSNIEGHDYWSDDDAGSIAKVGLDGKVIAAQWVKGLQAPKGMGAHGNYLFVADNNDVVTIDIEKGKIVDSFQVPGSSKLNDLSVAVDGSIYVTDSETGILHKIVNRKVINLVAGVNALNGVLHSQGELLFAADGVLYLLEEDGKHKAIASGMVGNTDGIERVDKDSWLVSCWAGTVYHVTRDGKVTLLLDGRPQKINAADLGYDPVNQIAYFPGFMSNDLAAYKLTVD